MNRLKKLCCLLLSLAMTASMLFTLPANALSAYDYTDNPVLAGRLDTLMNDIAPVGSYFTANGSPCNHSANSTCTNCRLDVVVSTRFSDLGVYAGYTSYTCYAFGQFVFNYLFGACPVLNYHGNDMDFLQRVGRISAGCSQLKGPVDAVEFNADTLYALFSRAKAGDLIAALNGDSGRRHVMVFLGCDAAGIEVYHANWGQVCNVAVTYLTWEDIIGYWSHVITVYRADEDLYARVGGGGSAVQSFRETPANALMMVTDAGGAEICSAPAFQLNGQSTVADRFAFTSAAEIIGYYTNNEGQIWYAVNYAGGKYWVPSWKLTFIRYTSSYTLANEVSPAGEYASLPYFDLGGKLTSVSKISRVTGEIIDLATGDAVLSADAPVNGYTFNIMYSRINYDLDFSCLPAGEYAYSLSMVTDNALPGYETEESLIPLLFREFTITSGKSGAVTGSVPEQAPVDDNKPVVSQPQPEVPVKETPPAADPAPAATEFSDVPSGQWYAEYASAAAGYGIMKGRADGTFAPDDEVTVAEAITMAARIYSISAGDGEKFTAASGEDWYTPYVNYAKEKGILLRSYYGAVTRKCARSEFADLLSRALPAEKLPAVNTVEDGAIPDVPMDHTYANAIYTLYRAGIVVGSDKAGTFRHDWTITRKEVAAIVVRMMDVDERMAVELKN